MKIVQINLNHCEAAQDLLMQFVIEEKIDVAIISEPYKSIQGNNWICDRTEKAAIWTCGKYPFQELPIYKESGYVTAKVNGVYIYSCYAAPSLDNSAYEQLIHRIARDGKAQTPIIIAGDFNAWAEEWGSKRTNYRGQLLLESFATLDITLANKGNKPTFRRQDRESVIDLTFVSYLLQKNMTWEVSEAYTHSDHQALVYKITSHTPLEKVRRRKNKGWSINLFDEEVFVELITSSVAPSVAAEGQAEYLANELVRACDASMPRRTQLNGRKQKYWWNEVICDLRSQCLKARRISQRSVGKDDHEDKCRKYKELRRMLTKEIKLSKRESFKQLCADVDVNPWGSAYRIVMAKIRGYATPPEKCPNILLKTITSLFPQHEARASKPRFVIDKNEIFAVTEEEILEACKRIGEKKAAGPDCIPNRVLKVAVRSNPKLFVEVMQSCLEEGVFPVRWKRQRLVLLPKPGKPPGEPSSSRPLGITDSQGKILERVIQNRLLSITESKEGLSDKQYGFRKARSTTDAINRVVDIARDAIAGKIWKGGSKEYCLVITLDVKNAFNTSNWEITLLALEKMKIPVYLLAMLESYFKDRWLEYDTTEGLKEYKISAGVPQGSVIGPLLWNIMYDDVLKLALPEGANVIGFADDIAITVRAKHVDEVELIANSAIARIQRWLASVGLSLAEQKTECVLISSRKHSETAKIKVGNSSIQSKSAIKYLGVIIDHRLSFKDHINYACEKASKVSAALSHILPNVGGPKSSRRALLSSVVSSTLLYGAPVWAKALQIKSNRKHIEKAYRLSALRVSSAYRTTSNEAVLVISGLRPIDLRVEESKALYYTKKENPLAVDREKERQNSIIKWQNRWNESDKGRWTKRLIPDIESWINRNHGEVNYQLTQFLTGHGCYRSYLHRFGLDESSTCPSCVETIETPEHVLFECPRFMRLRSHLHSFTGVQLNSDNVVATMLQSEENWNEICSVITDINNELRRAEKYRKQIAMPR